MAKNNKSKVRDRRRTRSKGQQQQQQKSQTNDTANNPQTPVNPKKRSLEEETEQVISKYLKTKTKTPTQRVANAKTSPLQAQTLNSPDPLGMELDEDSAKEKTYSQPDTMGDPGQDGSTLTKKPEVTKQGDIITGLDSELVVIATSLRRLKKQVGSFRKRLAKLGTAGEE